jgi:hypothetical protein
LDIFDSWRISLFTPPQEGNEKPIANNELALMKSLRELLVFMGFVDFENYQIICKFIIPDRFGRTDKESFVPHKS